jgi:hypothetical protein
MAVVAAQNGGKNVDDVATDESDVDAEVIQDGIAGKAAAMGGKDSTFSSTFNQVRAPTECPRKLHCACIHASFLPTL